MKKHVVIIGNGIAGITAARYIRKMSDHAVTVISAESKHFFSRTALMYVYMGHMRFKDITPYEDWFWDKNRINLIQAYVQKVDPNEQLLYLSSGKDVHYDDLILATGSTFNKFGWPGQNLEGVGGLYSLQDLEYMETYTKDASRGVIVGGGLIGIEMAEMLLSRGIDVSFLVRESSYWNNVLPAEESAMVNRHIKEHHVDLRLSTELATIEGDEKGRVKSVTTKDGETIPCQWVGLTAGVHANVGFLEGSGIETQRGIMIDHYFRTNIPNVYAIGDCAQFREALPGRRPMEQIWYTGKMHGETVAMTVCGNDRIYTPGVFFNSAKFFDIEYHTYGDVLAGLPEDQHTLYWEHEGGKKCIRINYRKDNQEVVGFNSFGIRYRHEVCDTWIREKRTLKYVLQHLKAANFDPEFFTRHEKDLVAAYNQTHPNDPIKLRSGGSIRKMLFGSRREVSTPKN